MSTRYLFRQAFGCRVVVSILGDVELKEVQEVARGGDCWNMKRNHFEEVYIDLRVVEMEKVYIHLRVGS